ncbi:MAG TPA: glycosyltransferase family A protein [Bacteroidales bacterium]|nr:glycosyltransferase family A protein [Bacteroidales bacterium]HPS50620.1 glycosyltransferase family A protein [Bacteroidales bacterium]
MDQEPPIISVIIPNYNRGDLLASTLDSLRLQDFGDWEAIVVDDGSTDNSRDIVNEWMLKDPRIRFAARDREPAGAPVCRNTGLHHAKGGFVIFLDSDDLLSPKALSQRISVIREHPDLDFWVFPMLMFRDDPHKAATLWNIDQGDSDLHRFLILDAPWQTTGPIWRKEAVQRIGGFTEGLACWQDVDFHLKALIAGLKGQKFYDLPPDAFYRQHETQSISQGEISSPAKLKSRLDIFTRHATSLLRKKNPPNMASAGRFNNDKVSGNSVLGVVIPSLKEIRADLRLLGGNIAIGAAQALNTRICLLAVGFGLRNRIFSWGVALQLLTILFFYHLRLNRISFFEKRLSRITQKYRQDSGIGKHPYYQKP